MRNFQLRDNCPLVPGTCLCGSQQGPIVDTLIDIRGGQYEFGRWYLCARCVEQAASLIGWIPNEREQELVEVNERLEAENLDLKNQLFEATPNVVKVDDLATLLNRK